MYFGAFVKFIVDNRIYNGSAVGVNPYSNEWDLIAKQLKQHGSGRRYGAGDYKSFDATEIPQIHYCILDIINKFYDDDNNLIRQILWLELVNSKHINEDMVYSWSSSLPSGNPLTTIVNNMYNHICFRYCWLASHSYNYKCLTDFTKNVYLIVLGDDNIFSVSNEALQHFNMLSIEENMKHLGMTYTSDDKNSQIKDMKTLEEITFLKRSFRYSDLVMRYVSPLSTVSIIEMLNWTTSGPQENTIVEDNIQTAFKELSLHDRNVFDVFTSKISKAISQLKLQPPETSSYSLCQLKTCAMESYY